MNELAASAIVLLVAPAFALGLFALQTLCSRTASSSRTLLPTSFTFFIAALAVATSTCNILASKDSAHASSTAAKISYACLKLFTGGAAMYLIQEPSLLRRLVAPFVFCSRHRVLSLLLLPSAQLFVSTALSIDLAARRQSSSVTDISLDILIACLATICLLICCALFARQIRDELRLRSIWLVLLLAQIGGILAAAFELDTRYGQVLRSLFTTIWLVCTILALHVFILLPPPASFSPAVQYKGQMSSPRMRDTLKVPIGDTTSRARHPSSPITPTEEYLRVQDPFASPPGSSLSHCQSFDDYDLEKLARLPSRERTFCDPTLPVLLLQTHPSPRRGLASSPLPSFPRELTLHAQEARDSATSSSFDVKTLVSPLYPSVENQKAEEIAIKSRFRESFSTLTSS